MSLMEHEKAVLLHRDFVLHPKYPYMVSKLNFAYNKARPDAERIIKMNFPGLIEVIYPGSFGCPDGYYWRFVLWYSVEEISDDLFGSVYVAFPYLNDHDRQDRVMLDRSIAVYTWGEVSQKTINKITSDLMYGLVKS